MVARHDERLAQARAVLAAAQMGAGVPEGRGGQSWPVEARTLGSRVEYEHSAGVEPTQVDGTGDVADTGGGTNVSGSGPGGGAEASGRGPGAGVDVSESAALARAVVLRQLAASPRSRAELAVTLARRNIPGPVADQVLDQLAQTGLIDDDEYAAMLVRTRHSERGLARPALQRELRRRGIDDEVVTRALDDVDPDSEFAAAERLVTKRLRSMTGLANEVKRRRLAAMLARRGHSSSTSRRVIEKALATSE